MIFKVVAFFVLVESAQAMPVAELFHTTQCHDLMNQIHFGSKELLQKAIPLMSFEKATREHFVLPPAKFMLQRAYGSEHSIPQYYKLAEAVAKSAYPDDIAVYLGSDLFIKYSHHYESYIVVHNRKLITLQNRYNNWVDKLKSYTLDITSFDEGFLRLAGLKQGPFWSDFKLQPGQPLSGFSPFLPSTLEIKFNKHKYDFLGRHFGSSREYEQAALDFAKSESTDTLMIVRKINHRQNSKKIIKFNYKTMEKVIIYYDIPTKNYHLLTYYPMHSGNDMAALFSHLAFIDDDVYRKFE